MRVALVALRTAAFALAVAACAGMTPSSVPTAPSRSVAPPNPSPTAVDTLVRSFTVQIEDGLQVSWNADAAAAATLGQIKASERMVGRALAEPRILSVDAWFGMDVPPEIGQGNTLTWPAVWVVRAEGTFVAFSCPQNPCPSGSSGFAMFDDTGAPIGTGFPLPNPEPSPDCAGVALPMCLKAVAISRRYQAIKPDDHVVAIHVRPTKVRMCDGIIEPKFDVSYTLQDPVAIFTVTVGQLPDGRWEACTY